MGTIILFPRTKCQEIPTPTQQTLVNELVGEIDGRHHDKALRLVEQIDDLDALSDKEWVTPLISACQARNIRMVRCLLQRGVDVHCTCELGYTPLMAAVREFLDYEPRIGLQIAKILLDCGSDVNATDDSGKTALMEAESVGSINLLLRAGVHIDARDNDGRTALIHAAKSGYRAGVEALLKAGADRTLRDKKGRTAFDHVPVKRWKILELLKVT